MDGGARIAITGAVTGIAALMTAAAGADDPFAIILTGIVCLVFIHGIGR